MSDLVDRIEAHAATLPRAERRVAEVVLGDPGIAAFATVAELGRRAGTSGATVVRLAERLGYAGWVGLQAEARAGLDQQLRPATERIREDVRGDVLMQTATREADNVHRTLAAVDRRAFDDAVAHLADRSRTVHVLAGDAEGGIGGFLTDALDLLRPDVRRVGGSAPTVARALAHIGRGDVLVAVDLRRYERWVLDAAVLANARGVVIIAITDSVLSPLAQQASVTFAVTAEGAGPFDSHVGTLALVNALASGVARKLRRTAAPRLAAPLPSSPSTSPSWPVRHTAAQRHPYLSAESVSPCNRIPVVRGHRSSALGPLSSPGWWRRPESRRPVPA
jgi:DNA-binding MurR/RpiR family transcriptional regulator